MAIGSLTERPETAADLVSDYGVAIGEVVLDLRELDVQDLGGRTLRVSAGIGEVVLIVPADVPVVLTGAVGIGESDVLGQERGGMPVRVDLADPRSAEGPVLTLDLRAGIGQIRVERATAR
jgi:predicted membrane protein